MEIEKQRVVPEHVETYVDQTLCDFCRRVIERLAGCDFEESTIELRWGKTYPDGGSSEGFDYDVCKQCFVEVLMPFFALNEAQPRVHELVVW